MPQFQAPVGTRDILAPESANWEWLIGLFRHRAELAGFGLLISPMFEDLAVFERMGEATDVVSKEMYDFADKGGRHLALRPEGTASVVRAWVQHRPPLPFKAWYAAPGFRYERPQAGRYRQHHQLGVEVLGPHDAELDIEVIALAASVIAAMGLRQVELVVNSLGDAQDRPRYLAILGEFLRDRSGQLCPECQRRLTTNPVRVLDCKKPGCRLVTNAAPMLLDHLSTQARDHFSQVLSGLSDLGVAFRVEPRLVRGLDYYTRTTFELAATSLESAQNGVGGGGRYDGLVEALGGPPTPGLGFAMGMERLLLAAQAERCLPGGGTGVEVFVVDTTGGRSATRVLNELRQAGFAAERAYDGRSMKAQFKAADRSGARLALVIGEREKEAGTVLIKEMAQGTQSQVSGDQLVARITQMLAGAAS
ncbi:MAG: histidine--tRNA ligase [Acidimicrobiales bacterium]